MRLFLSSYRLGRDPQLLRALVGDGCRAAVITNAHDPWPESVRDALIDEIKDLGRIGIEAEGLDLRAYFGREGDLANVLGRYDLVWVKGGNTFVLRRAMAYSGFDAAVKILLAEDRIVYGGYSAGSIAATPTLRGTELVDEPEAVPDGYQAEVVWEGLNLVPYSIAPHFQSDHPESADIDNVVAHFAKHRMPYKTLSDGEVIVVDERSMTAPEANLR